MHARMHACMYVCMYVCLYVCMYECMYVCMYVCMQACMYVCMCVCMCVCMYAYMFLGVYIYMYVCNARRLQISELLWFFFDNLKELNSEIFKTTLLEFYTAEDINNSKKLLLNDLDNIKKEKIKLPSRNNTKLDRYLDIVDIIIHAQKNELLLQLPLYVIFNINKVPNYNGSSSNNITSTLVETKMAKFEEKLEKISILEQSLCTLSKQMNYFISNLNITNAQNTQNVQPLNSTSNNYTNQTTEANAIGCNSCTAIVSNKHKNVPQSKQFPNKFTQPPVDEIVSNKHKNVPQSKQFPYKFTQPPVDVIHSEKSETISSADEYTVVLSKQQKKTQKNNKKT